jgi:hypothetical protein
LDQVREAFFSLWFGPELRGSADSQSGMARERLVEPNATGSHGFEEAVAQGQVGDQPVGRFVDISSAEAQDQVAVFDFRSRALMNLPKIGSKFDMLVALRADRLNDHLAGHARNWLFAGWIDIRNEGEVGASKRPAEFFLECQCARIAVRLKHDEHPFPTTGSSGCNGGGDLGGMMSVIINHQIPSGLVANFKPSSRTAESFEGGHDVVEREPYFQGESNYRKSIHGVVSARDV